MACAARFMLAPRSPSPDAVKRGELWLRRIERVSGCKCGSAHLAAHRVRFNVKRHKRRSMSAATMRARVGPLQADLSEPGPSRCPCRSVEKLQPPFVDRHDREREARHIQSRKECTGPCPRDLDPAPPQAVDPASC